MKCFLSVKVGCWVVLKRKPARVLKILRLDLVKRDDDPTGTFVVFISASDPTALMLRMAMCHYSHASPLGLRSPSRSNVTIHQGGNDSLVLFPSSKQV